MQWMWKWMRRPRCVASSFLLWGTGQDLLGVSGSGMISPWQWTDVFLGTRPKLSEVPYITESNYDYRRHSFEWQASYMAANEAQGMKSGRLGWEVARVGRVWTGRNPLSLWKAFELPRTSASRLRRMLGNYFPLVKEYFDSDRARRKKLLDAWIPAIADATLEAKLKNAIEEQWRLEIAPGQKNDPDRLPMAGDGGAKFFLDFGEAKDGNAGGVSADFSNSPGGASRGLDWIRDLERTFGFGYQLLRSCAVDGYELPYFQQHVEKKWEALFNDAHSSAKASSLQRTLKAMRPPPEAGPFDDQMGEESLRDYPPEKREEGRRDRQRLWRERVQHFIHLGVGGHAHQATPKAVKYGAWALLGPFPPEAEFYDKLLSLEVEPKVDEQEAETISDAVRSILDLRMADLRVDAVSLNELDGGRLSSYPEGLTLEQNMTFRARRNLIEGERQREDLKNYEGEGMQLLQSALLPFAYGNADAWVSPVGASILDQTNELAEDLKKAAKSKSLSPKAKEVAKHAALIVSDAAEVAKQFTHPVASTDVAAREAAALESNAGSACVRLFAWAKRHQMLSRMARLNLAVRLKLLANPGRFFHGGLSKEDMIEREMPTAVGPVAGKSGSPLALDDNQKYTNLFYLLRDNTKKMLHEIPPVTWEDFDTWAKRQPEIVRRTPWDKEYVPPWERPIGVPPAGGGEKQDDDRHYRSWFLWAVTGIAVFGLGLAVVLVLLILECRRSVALQQRRKTKTKIKGSGQEQSPELDRPHSAGQQELQRAAAPARAARGVLVPAEGEESDALAPPRSARTRTADYRIYVRDQQPQPKNNLDTFASCIDPGPGGPGPHDYCSPIGFDPFQGNPQVMQPLVQEWQAVMGLQLHDSKSEVDGGQVRFLPPPENPHAPARTEQGNAAPPWPGHQYEVDGKVLGASGLVVPDRALVPRAPPNSHVTGASETAEGADNASPMLAGGQQLRGPAPG